MSEGRQPGAAHHGGEAFQGVPLAGRSPGPASIGAVDDRLSLALEAARAGWWEWNVTSNENVWSPELFRLYGLDPAKDAPSYESWRHSIHPDDVDAAESAVRAAARDGTELNAEWRVRLDGSEERWLMSRGRPRLGPDGRPTHYVGVVIDVTERHRAEQAVRESEARVRAVLDSLAEGVVFLDTNGVVTSANAAVTRIQSRTAEDLSDPARDPRWSIRRPDGSLFPEEEQPAIVALRTQEPVRDVEMVVPLAAGGQVWLNVSAQPVRDSRGRLLGAVASFSDMSARKRTESALRESEARLRTIFADAVDPYFISDFEGRFVDANRRACESLGYDREELLSLSIPDIHPGFDLEAAKTGWAHVEPGRTYTVEGTHRRKDGSTFPVEIRYGLTELGGQQVLLSLSRDVTERVEGEKRLRDQADRLSAFFESPVVGTLQGDVRGGILSANDEFLRIIGYDREDLEAGRVRWDAVTPPEFLHLDVEGIAEARERGSCTPYEKQYARKDGSRIWVLVGYALVGERRDESVAFVLDISKQKAAQEAVVSSEKRFRALFERMTQGVVYQERDGTITDANPAAQHILGLTLDQMQGRTSLDPRWRAVDEHGEPMPGERHPAMLALRTGQVVRDLRQGIFNPERDEIRWITASSVPEFREGEETPVGVFSTFDDITERKRAEEALAENRAKLVAALEAMSSAVFISDSDGRFVEFNEAFATIHRFRDKAECLKRLDDYPALLDVMLEDGVPLPLSRWAIPRALAGETATNAEFTLRRKDTGETWVGSYNFAPIRNEAGSIVGAVAVGSDVTDRKRAESEIRELNATLEARVKERTEELEGFSYSVSHDLRAPLRAIDGFARLLEEEHAASLDDEGKRLLGVVRRNTRQMGQLIDDLLAFSRVGRAAMNPGRVEMEALARAAWAELGADASRAAFAAGPLPDVHGDAGLLRQVWVNLLSNAVKFSARAESPRVEVSASAADGRVTFSVRDNGVGFDPAYGEKLFHVFQRLHSPREFPGTGVGLALVERIVRRHGGSVSAEGNPGVGATFRFTLPVQEVRA